MPQRAIHEVLKERTAEWMAISGVVGVGLGECKGRPCLAVYVARKTAELTARFPETVEGHPVCLTEIGEIEALQ